MQAPNVLSVAIIVGVIALCEGLADTLPGLGKAWVPFAVVLLGALVKGLQVYLQDQRAVRSMAGVRGHKVRRWLIQ